MKRAVIVLLVAISLCPLLKGRHRKGATPNPKLCELKSVFIKGNSESAKLLRQQIEKRTWLRLAPSADKADAIFEAAETKSTRGFPVVSEETTVSATVTRRDGDELMWSSSASFSQGALNSGAGSSVKVLLAHLAEDAGCGK